MVAASDGLGAAAVADAGDNDTLTCFVEWGDGTGDAGTLSEAGVCTASHAYAAAGPYTVTVTASDDDEADGSDTVAITVTATPPVATVPDNDAAAAIARQNPGNVSIVPAERLRDRPGANHRG